MKNDKPNSDLAVSSLTYQRGLDYVVVFLSSFTIALSMLLALMTFGWGFAGSSPQYELGAAKVFLTFVNSVVSITLILDKPRMHGLKLLILASLILANSLIVYFCQSYEVFKAIEPALVWDTLLVSGIAIYSLFSSQRLEGT